MEYAIGSHRKETKVTVVFVLVCLLALPVLAAGSSTPAGGKNAFHPTSTEPDAMTVSRRPILTFTPGIVTTFAGTGEVGYAGDGGSAASAQFNSPMGVARDSRGNLFIADLGNSVVRKIDADGKVSTVAGNGTQGYSGDGGPATSAQLAFPSGVAVDAAGNLYIADFLNSCVRKVDTNGIISTLASGYLVRSVAVDNLGNVYFTGWYEGVWKVDSQGQTVRVAGNGTAGFAGDGGLATDAETSGVSGLALSPLGNLYLSEWLNSDIRMIDGDGIISTVVGDHQVGFAGDGDLATNARLNGPAELRFDPAGNLYLLDSSNNRIRKVNADGVINTIAGDGNYGYSGDSGLASQAQFAGPVSLALDEFGNQFIADTGNNVIRKLSVESTTLDFGQVTVGQTGGSLTVVVSNAGNGDMHISSISVTGDFTVSSKCSVSDPLASGTECSIAISFVPTVEGPLTGTVTVQDDAPGSPHLIQLKGHGYVIPVATQLVFANKFPNRQLNSNLGAAVVHAADSSGNLATSFNGSVALQLLGPAGFSTFNTQLQATNGTVTFDLSAIPLSVAGSYTITAGSTGLTSAQATFVVTGNPDFAIAASRPSINLATSGRGTVDITVTPSNGLNAAVGLTCSGLPAHSTCSFFPASLKADGVNTPLTSVMTLSTGVATSAAIRNSGEPTYLALTTGTFSLGLIGLAFVPWKRTGSHTPTRLTQIAQLMLIVVILCGGLVGCGTLSGGGGGQDNLTPPGTYKVTVTGSSNGIIHSTVVTLVVQ